MPFGFTLKPPFLPRAAVDLHYQEQQFQQQEYSQPVNANTRSPSSFFNRSNDITLTATLSDAFRSPELRDALERTIRKRLDCIRKETDRRDRHRLRAVQKRRRRCLTNTDSGREKTDYSDVDRCCQSLPRSFEKRRRSSLPIHGGQSRKDRKMSRRAVKEPQYYRHLNTKCCKMLSELELNEREHQPLIRTSTMTVTPPPLLPSASDIRAYQEYHDLHASIDYDKIHHDPKEMRKYQELERVGKIFLRERSSFELALLAEMAMSDMASVKSGRTTVFDSGLTAAEWVEAQGWMLSPSADPLVVFTMHTPDQSDRDNEESGTVAETNSGASAASGNNTAALQSTEPSSHSTAPTATSTTSTTTRTSSLWRLGESVAPSSIITSHSTATTTSTAPAETNTPTTNTSTTATHSTTHLRQSPSTNISINTSANTSSNQPPIETSTPPQQGRRARSPTRRLKFRRNFQARYFSQDEESNGVAAASTGGSHADAGTLVDESLIDNERINRNKAFGGVAEARRREEAALKKARRKVMRAQVRREEEDALLAEEIREQQEQERKRREANSAQPLDPVAEEARQQRILDQLEKRRIRDECLDDELRELLELERQRDESERTTLMEQSGMGDQREKRRETRRLQMLKNDDDLTNMRLSTRRQNLAVSGSAPGPASTAARMPVLTRVTSYAEGRDSTSTTNSMVPSVFDSTITVASTTCHSHVPDSPSSSLASEQESLPASPARLSEAEQKREDMNHLADRNVEDLARRARAAARERSPSGSDKSDTDSGREPQSVKRRGIFDEDDDDDGEEYDQDDDEYEKHQQQQDDKHRQKQQDDYNAGEGSSSGRRRKAPQELQLERDEALARELQDAEDSQRLSNQGKINEDTVQQRSESRQVAAGETGAGIGTKTGHEITLERQQLENDMAMAKRMQQEENDNQLQSDSRSNSIIRRKLSLRIMAQKERRLSSTSERTTPAAPTIRPKKTTTSMRSRSTPSAAKQKQPKLQKQQKPTRKLTRLLAARSSASSTTPVQASSPSILSAVETSPPPLSLPPPMLSSTTHSRRISVSSLLTTSSTPSPTGWDFPSPGRSSSRSPTGVHTSLYTPYKRSGSPQLSRTRSHPTRSTRPSPPCGQHSQRSYPPQAIAEHQSQPSRRSPQPEQSKEGLNLLADVCEKVASLPSSSLSTSVSTLATGQVHQCHNTTGTLAGESTTKTTTTTTATNTTPTSTSNQPSPYAEPRSSTATTVPVTPAQDGTGFFPEEAYPRTSRRSQRIQERGMNERVSKHLTEEKARKEEEEYRKAKEMKKKGCKPRAIKEENKEEAKEAMKKGRKSRATEVEAREEAEEAKPKGSKRKATEEASEEDVVVKKGRKPKAVTEEEAKEEVTVVKTAQKPKAAKEVEMNEEETKEETTEAKKKGRTPKSAKVETKEEATVVKRGRKPKTVTAEKKEETEEAKPKSRKRKATEEAKAEEDAEVKTIRKPRVSKKDTQEEHKGKDVKGKGKRAKK